jgi:hypothetical protein
MPQLSEQYIMVPAGELRPGMVIEGDDFAGAVRNVFATLAITSLHVVVWLEDDRTKTFRADRPVRVRREPYEY